MHAERALYRTASKYVNYDAKLEGATRSAPLRPSRNATPRSATSMTRSASTIVANSARGQSLVAEGQSCLTGSALQDCVQRGRSKLDGCYALCDEQVCNPQPDKPGPCRQCYKRCDAVFNSYAAQCYDQQCGPGLSCVPNEFQGADAPVCCPPGTWGCGDVCLPDCPSPGYVKDALQCGCICDAASGYVDCYGKCIRLADDPAHCGSCDIGCPKGQLCCDGQCKTCTDDACCGACPNNCLADGKKCCQKNGVYGCATLQENTSCGSCTNDCTVDGKVCRRDPTTNAWGCACPDGQQACGSDCCSAGTDCCQGLCTNKKQYQWDQKNCGKCKKKCDPGELCCKGVCAAIWKDPNNCGACGSPCSTTCCSGQCCAQGELCCDGKCTKKDKQNCMDCAKGCDPSEDWDCCFGTCTNIRTSDVSNCGACGKKCATGQVCLKGVCTTIQPCSGTAQVSGGPRPDSRTFSLGTSKGRFEFDYVPFDVVDRFKITYENQVIFDSGCDITTSAEWRQTLHGFNVAFSGTSTYITVDVEPNCANDSRLDTHWSYIVHCPTTE